MKVVDGDSHFIEPLDLFQRHIDPAYRDRAMRVDNDPNTGKPRMLVDNKPMRVGNDIDEMLSVIVGFGQKEDGHALHDMDRTRMAGGDWANMDKRVQFCDAEGIDYQVLFPTLGLLWEGEVKDAQLAAALCRAYNTWAFEVCAGQRVRYTTRAFPRHQARKCLASLGLVQC